MQKSHWKRTLSLVSLVLLLLIPMGGQALTGSVYEVFVASYYDGNQDGMGDLPGLVQKLDYIKALGADNLWLMPIHPSPSYHKYDVLDYCAIDPDYGTMADFDTLLHEMDQREMGLILDFVVNHTSNLHPWFLSACESLSIPDCGKETCTANEGLCVRHNPYVQYYHFSKEEGGHSVPNAKDWFYKGSFGGHMPDLNLNSELVRQELIDIMRFWLDKGVAGFRLDAVVHYYEENVEQNTQFLQWLNQQAKMIKEDCYIVAEAWKDKQTIASLAESGIDSFFDFPMGNSTGELVMSLKKREGAKFAQKVVAWQDMLSLHNPNGVNATFLTNHDMGRISGVLVNQQPKMKMAASMMILQRGIPFVYYGEEIGMSGSGRDENKRLPMLWDTTDQSGACLPPAMADQTQRLTIGVMEQSQDPNSLWSHYHNLLTFVKEMPILQTGTMSAIDCGISSVAALNFDGLVQVYHNLDGKKPVVIPQVENGLLKGTFPAENKAEITLVNGQLTLPPLSTAVVVSDDYIHATQK